ncbi:MAG TPA: hypothetical protein VHV10_20500 [Ktedonobacteraceae bacterium]|nr:hypothetical protein [Ktedonobacteraceae bacterium]
MVVQPLRLVGVDGGMIWSYWLLLKKAFCRLQATAGVFSTLSLRNQHHEIGAGLRLPLLRAEFTSTRSVNNVVQVAQHCHGKLTIENSAPVTYPPRANHQL